MHSRDAAVLTRRRTLQSLGAIAGAIAVPAVRALAQQTQLPLRTSGLEHIGMTVPDQEATAKFYGRIFDPQLFQERDPPPRFYARLGISYIAFGGGNANNPGPPRIDHFCALVEDYKAQDMRKALEEAGIQMGTGPGGMAQDPDGLRLQLLGVPGGLAKTIVPASRISQEAPLVQAIGFDHIVLAVSDLERSAAYYRKFFGRELSRTKKPERVRFAAAKTRLGLQPVAAGQMPSVDHICIRIASFDRRAVADRLKMLGAQIAPSNDEHLLRFKDPNGLVMELEAGA
ncbi:MAG TPA: VOC family protein [Bryobacteraceae bacterium]|jgi:catechol 2,3-dioxygenase-like lactoylglutathione lyase family enzyme